MGGRGAKSPKGEAGRKLGGVDALFGNSSPRGQGIHPNGEINRGAGVYSTLTDEQKDTIQECLDRADKDVAELYLVYEDKLVLIDGNYNGPEGAYYSPSEHGVYMNVKQELENDDASTWFHEFGHFIDYDTRMNGAAWSGDDDRFLAAIKRDYANFIGSQEVAAHGRHLAEKDIEWRIESYERSVTRARERGSRQDETWAKEFMLEDLRSMGYLDKRAVRKLEKLDASEITKDAIMNNLKVSAKRQREIAQDYIKTVAKNDGGGWQSVYDVTDVFNGASNGNFKACAYHGTEYWKQYQGSVQVEGYANITDALSIGGSRRDMVMRFLPESYNEYKRLVAEKRSVS